MIDKEINLNEIDAQSLIICHFRIVIKIVSTSKFDLCSWPRLIQWLFTDKLVHSILSNSNRKLDSQTPEYRSRVIFISLFAQKNKKKKKEEKKHPTNKN